MNQHMKQISREEKALATPARRILAERKRRFHRAKHSADNYEFWCAIEAMQEAEDFIGEIERMTGYRILTYSRKKHWMEVNASVEKVMSMIHEVLGVSHA